ncbi:unnamed protein product [Rotaria magnacalcarata]|uniref:Dol-P-Glc:Glc(2)Man(9)GlcNAc(2)-PP-Dol alpha-1,2-glucosyltransferase n=1 Tax=Rotaria magnacalcarata TaxID=392030 RepID=A0A818WXG4_9BILA|nr:unnamed protein product [Rotaria magnacalcarata]
MVRSTFVNLILYKLFALITIYLFVCIHKEVPEPYMDEYFHFHQAANYCSGNYTHWDPSITTPPGLYMITHLLEMMLNSIQILDKTFGACSLGLARFTNVIFMLALPFVFMKYLEKIKKDDEQVSMLSALCMSCHPLIYFFTFLYYTDVGSLFFAMVSLTTHVYHYRFLSSMFSIIALTFRQTNIIIVAYEIGLTIIEEFRSKNKQSHILHVYTSRSSDTIEIKEYFIVLWKYGRLEIKLILNLIQSIIWTCRYNLCVIILFVLFFIKNNYSMTLGHQEHHQIVLHLAQMHYYATYTAFFVGAHIIQINEDNILNIKQRKKRIMNSSVDMQSSMIELDDDDDDDKSKSSDDYQYQDNTNKQEVGTHVSRSAVSNTSSTATSTNGAKRQKDISPCYVCGAKAHGYNFDQITCESCKAFFRRNALKSMDKFRCRNNNNCLVISTTRKRCKRCRLTKCFKVGMRKEWILTEEEKRSKRKKIERNRLIKQQEQLANYQRQQQNKNLMYSNTQRNISSSSITKRSSSSKSQRLVSKTTYELPNLPVPLICMHRPSDQQMYQSQLCLLKQLSDGYQLISQQYPQPSKFSYRNALISQTIDMETKLLLVKDLTRDLTQMTTSRLLNYFSLIPEFQLLTDLEKKSILIKNMLSVFMFHGALTYNAQSDVFVDRTTADQPYDAKYILLVYGAKVYNNFIALAHELASLTYQSPTDTELDERSHTLFLLLMIVLLFSNGFDSGFDTYSMEEEEQQKTLEKESNTSIMSRSLSITSESISSSSSSSSSSLSPSVSPLSTSKLNEKLHKIQQMYIEMTCRYLHDAFGLTVGRRMFQNILPLLFDLQKLCATLANVNLCELAEDEDRLSSSRSTTHSITPRASGHQTISSQFNSTISETSNLNEFQKENRVPSHIIHY